MSTYLKTLATLVVAVSLLGCSTTGGIYTPTDPHNNAFSLKKTLQKTAVVVALVGVTAIAVKAGAGGKNYAPNSSETNDYDWAWGQFYNEHSLLVWACRGLQTGQFADLDKCEYKLKLDNTWPSKQMGQRLPSERKVDFCPPYKIKIFASIFNVL